MVDQLFVAEGEGVGRDFVAEDGIVGRDGRAIAPNERLEGVFDHHLGHLHRAAREAHHLARAVHNAIFEAQGDDVARAVDDAGAEGRFDGFEAQAAVFERGQFGQGAGLVAKVEGGEQAFVDGVAHGRGLQGLVAVEVDIGGQAGHAHG